MAMVGFYLLAVSCVAWLATCSLDGSPFSGKPEGVFEHNDADGDGFLDQVTEPLHPSHLCTISAPLHCAFLRHCVTRCCYVAASHVAAPLHPLRPFF
jgi:hypothetical protein